MPRFSALRFHDAQWRGGVRKCGHFFAASRAPRRIFLMAPMRARQVVNIVSGHAGGGICRAIVR
jgi:hypothetical protein